MIYRFILVLSFFFTVLTAQTWASDTECTDFHYRFDAFHFHRFKSSGGKCFLSADPFDISNFVYRSYLLTESGMLMVFNSFDEFETPASSGARVFHFFPRTGYPGVEEVGDQIHLKFATDKVTLVLKKSESRILSAVGATVQEADAVTPANKGGLEFSNVKTLYLDSGFGMGGDVTARPNLSSKFIDINGRACTVKNSEVFNLVGTGDSEFKFNDSELKTFLKKRCPKIKVNF